MNYGLADTFLFVGDEELASIKAIVDSQNHTMWTRQQSMAKSLVKDVKTIRKNLNSIFLMQ